MLEVTGEGRGAVLAAAALRISCFYSTAPESGPKTRDVALGTTFWKGGLLCYPPILDGLLFQPVFRPTPEPTRTSARVQI